MGNGIRLFAIYILVNVVYGSICIDNSCSRDSYHPHVPKSHWEQKGNTRSKSSLKVSRIKRSTPQQIVEHHGREAVSSKIERDVRSSEEEKTAEYWINVSQDILKRALEVQNLNTNVAKNTIIFLGDGMGVQTITAGRILKGQMQGKSGEETKLVMEQFPHVGLSKTYNVDHQVPDSAGTGTAYLTGVKTRYGVLGLNGAAVYRNCSSAKGNEVSSVLKDSKKEGKSTGIVTSTILNHATPSAAYANCPYRYWYSDTDLSTEAKENGCKDIAQQLYDNLPLIDVALGGGRRYFRPEYVEDEEYPTYNYERKDGQDLIKKWEENMAANGLRASFVWNKDQFDNIDSNSIDRLWGMFEQSHMQFEADRDKTKEPSLAELTRKAIEILQKNEKGFYLLVEGGRIDHAHHDTNAYRALHELVALDEAVETAKSMTSESDTLIVVTADHSHTFNMGGKSNRGNPIFGLAPSNERPGIAMDLKYYTTLSYGNGEGYQGDLQGGEFLGQRENVTVEMAAEKDYLQQTAVPISSESHGGEDVVIMASGPLAHLFHGVHEQNYIAHVMRYATCVGDNKDHCQQQTTDAQQQSEITEFLGYQLSRTDAEAALYSLFALELFFTVSIIALCFTLLYKKK